jgi:heme oxygenase
MPCAATPRGLGDTQLPWSDLVNNNPCGKAIVSTVNGVSVAAENLCLAHWAIKHGLADVKGQVVFGA